jgi:hypothetical protein
MSADITELIEHLSRHEGGALGACPLVIEVTGQGRGRILRTGVSVDAFLSHLRGVAAGKESATAHVATDGLVTMTTRTGEPVELTKVLGWDFEQACVVIEARELAGHEAVLS